MYDSFDPEEYIVGLSNAELYALRELLNSEEYSRILDDWSEMLDAGYDEGD